MSNKGETMNKQAFNEHCASIMGYEVTISMAMVSVVFPNEPIPREYDPYEDLNQAAEVVEKLIRAPNFEVSIWQSCGMVGNVVRRSITIKQAFRSFIESTAGDKQ